MFNHGLQHDDQCFIALIAYLWNRSNEFVGNITSISTLISVQFDSCVKSGLSAFDLHTSYIILVGLVD